MSRLRCPLPIPLQPAMSYLPCPSPFPLQLPHFVGTLFHSFNFNSNFTGGIERSENSNLLLLLQLIRNSTILYSVKLKLRRIYAHPLSLSVSSILPHVLLPVPRSLCGHVEVVAGFLQSSWEIKPESTIRLITDDNRGVITTMKE